jgi:hypothetical protein
LADEGPVAWSSTGQLAVPRESPPLAIVFPSSGRRIPLPGLHAPIELGGGIVWSPDGSKLAFVAADADGVGDVWTVNADGTDLTRLTHDLDAAGVALLDNGFERPVSAACQPAVTTWVRGAATWWGGQRAAGLESSARSSCDRAAKTRRPGRFS